MAWRASAMRKRSMASPSRRSTTLRSWSVLTARLPRNVIEPICRCSVTTNTTITPPVSVGSTFASTLENLRSP
jgi:hypothetical protein